MAQVVILMGVSGSGKTTVGQALADRLGWDFFDADDFHAQANIEKMAQGIALNDADRLPWLTDLHELLHTQLLAGKSAVLACSALKSRYRSILQGDFAAVKFVFLQGSYDLIRQRLETRPGHFMPADLLQSQFDALERPDNALTIDADDSVEELVEQIVKNLDLLSF